MKVIDFEDPTNNRFLAVREFKPQDLLVPHYDRRADLVCYVNGLPLVFIELKAVYKNIRAGFDENLTDYPRNGGWTPLRVRAGGCLARRNEA